MYQPKRWGPPCDERGGITTSIALRAHPEVDPHLPAEPLRTPYLLLDVDLAVSRFTALAGCFGPQSVHYAVKANPHPALVAALAAVGSRFDVASPGELDLCLAAGVDPAHLVYSNPVKRRSDIAYAHHLGVGLFAADSWEEIVKLSQAASGSDVLVRLSTSGAGSDWPLSGKFGCSPDEAVDLVRRMPGLGLVPYGLTFHVGSQAVHAGAWSRAIATCGVIMRRLDEDGVRLRLLDLGGGYPVPYDTAMTGIEEIGAVVTDAVATLPYPVALAVEPGRYLTAEAGTMTATVIGRARRRGKDWLHLDVGAFGGLMEALETDRGLHNPVTCQHGHAAPVLTPMSVTGPTCDSEDTVLIDAPVCAELVTGDRVRIGCTGAYTTAYASTFNGFELPSTIVL